MNIDIASLITDALALAGCGDKLTQDLDPHAGVELDFLSIPKISIEAVEESVVLHCCISEYAAALRMSQSHAVLDIVTPKAPWAHHHVVSLMEDKGELYLTAVVSAQCLRDGQSFSVALEGFHERVQQLQEAAQG